MASFAGNRVVQQLGCDVPIIQAPMGWIARAQLVSAVVRAGAMGIMETSTGDLASLQRDFAAIRAVTDRPIGLNLAIKFLKGDAAREREVLRWALDGRVRFITTSAGDPGRYVWQIREAGVTVYHSVATLNGALKAIDADVDGLVVEGDESGGVRGNDPVHAMVLLQAVRERTALPIVAAGGIVDGCGMAAAFALGADAIAMGTRFVASAESPVHMAYKQAIVDAAANGTVKISPGGRAMWRALRTDYTRGLSDGPIELDAARMIDDLYVHGRLDRAPASAGESSALIHEVKPVAAIIEDCVSGFWQAIDRLAALRDAAGSEK